MYGAACGVIAAAMVGKIDHGVSPVAVNATPNAATAKYQQHESNNQEQFHWNSPAPTAVFAAHQDYPTAHSDHCSRQIEYVEPRYRAYSTLGSHSTICGNTMQSPTPSHCSAMKFTAARKIVAMVISGGATLFR